MLDTDWQKVFELDVTFAVGSIGSGGRFTREIATIIAREDKSYVKDQDGKIVEDFRK